MASYFNSFQVKTPGRTGFINITRQVKDIVHQSRESEGLCTVFIPHTTCAVTINEAADPDVVRDMDMELNKIVPFDDGYTHFEGNSAAHIKTTLTGPSLSIPIHKGELTLGTWQGIYLAEFDGSRTRDVKIQILS